jgi:hypothetical protein
MFKIIFCAPRFAAGADFGGGLVPYPIDHRRETRARIVGSARHLFNRHGFETVSIKQIMAVAGLTHGGFCYFDKASSTPRRSPASSPTRNGRTAGKGWKWI